MTRSSPACQKIRTFPLRAGKASVDNVSPRLRYPSSYATERAGISVPVVLKSGDVRLAASIDTGAAFCLFRAELATALGLDLTSSELKRFRTANSNFDAYGHEVEVSVLGLTTFATVYFFADAAINKNVLGRVGWLDRVRLGLVEHDSHIYLAPYDQA